MTRERFQRDQKVRPQKLRLISYLDRYAEESLGRVPTPNDELMMSLEQTDTIPTEDFFLKVLPRLRKEPHWSDTSITRYFRSQIINS